ncbi:MAG: hypothetical protein A3H91_03315 [Gammaproteobacteria bacterium RIFCSPLOWO2_02_FULL_61_13]|nr:MAG: hypothetical protein A3H91_03315 [Gammaproteobacteria bacterium RIFCSPLOWO2_02_FULL_61_13]
MSAIKTGKFVIVAATMITGLSLVFPASAAIKCWTNNEGVRECGESVPPEFAQQGHEVIKQSGAVEETERAKTPEELAVEKAKADAEAEIKHAEQEKVRQDGILLATFSTVEDIERVRDEQITALDATISVTKTRNSKIQQDLDKRIEAAAAEERAGKTPNEALLKDIESLRRQTENNQQFIEAKHKEQESIRQQYGDKILRFKELKGL